VGDDIAIFDMSGKSNFQRQWTLAITTDAITCDSQSADVPETLLVEFVNCESEYLIAVQIQKLNRPSDLMGETWPSLGPANEKLIRLGDNRA
jgi:hypothetical protein